MRARLLVGTLLAAIALSVLSGCLVDVRVDGATAGDRRIAQAVADYLLGIDDFDWPHRVRVDNKTVTLVYRHRVDDEFAKELSFEVSDAIHYELNQEEWSLIVKSPGDNRSTQSRSFSLPAQALSGDTVAVGGVTITMPFNWDGEWTTSPNSSLVQPPTFVLTTDEPPLDDDFDTYTSTVHFESHETTQAAFEAREQLAEARRRQGWSGARPVRMKREGFDGSVTRLVAEGTVGPQTVTDLILLPDSGGAVRIVSSDKDAADQLQATRSLDELANDLIELFKVSAGGV